MVPQGNGVKISSLTSYQYIEVLKRLGEYIAIKHFSNILFVATTAADNAAAFEHALAVASNHHAKLTLLGLVDAPIIPRVSAQLTAYKIQSAMVAQERARLQALIKDSSAAGAAINVEIRVGKQFIEIIRDVLQHRRDLVIKCAERPRSMGQRLFGSADMKLMRQCPCPLWVTKPTRHKGQRTLLAAVDYDEDDAHDNALNPEILALASALALSEFAELHVVHAWRLEYESFLRSARSSASQIEVDLLVRQEEEKRRLWLEALVETHCAAPGAAAIEYLKPQVHLINGDASHTVLLLADDIGAELVVMGTVGRAGIPGWIIGNTAENILAQIDCSVLTIKPVGFVSPVTLNE